MAHDMVAGTRWLCVSIGLCIGVLPGGCSPLARASGGHSPASIEIAFELPPGAFFESIAVTDEGSIFFNERSEHVVYRLVPGNQVEVWAHPPKGIALAGLAVDARGVLYASGVDANGDQSVLRVKQNTVEVIARLPDAAFLNGITFLTGQTLLAAESYLGVTDGSTIGRIYVVDVASGRVEVFLEHELLGRGDASRASYPAANGLKIFEDAVWVTNSERAAVLRVPLDADLRPGPPEVFVSGITGDDFAVAQDGTLYITTHPMNSLVRVSQDGSVRTVADADDGMVGSTAAAFGRAPGDASSLYVVTNGGSYIPPPTGIETAKLLRVTTGTTGYVSPRGR